jgi:hypothetical protein
MSDSSASASASAGGIGFSGLLTVLFIGLKLTHVIDWSWLWVLAPMWVSTGLIVVILFAVIALTIWAKR